MPNIDVSCKSETCGVISEVYRALADWPKTPPCPTCGGETEQILLPKAVTWTVDPVVVYKAPDGSFRFPGDANGSGAGKYDKLGYERVEIRGALEMRAFESKMNAHERSQMARRFEHAQEQREAREKANRSELRRRMQSMSAFGRGVAIAAMARNDAKPRKRVGDPGFVSEVYSYTRSNREASRDDQGRRRRD